MKRQNGVVLSGKLADLRAAEVKAGDLTGMYTMATLITDHQAFGGHHCVLFPAEHAPDALAYWGLTDGNLEVTIEGWLRSTPGTDGGPPVAVVVVDRVIYLTVTDAMRELVGRHKAGARGGRPGGKRGGGPAGRVVAQRARGGAQPPPASRPPAQGAGGERTGAEAAPAGSPGRRAAWGVGAERRAVAAPRPERSPAA